MTVLSGGLVYEWTEEGNQFGLVTANSNGSLNLLPDYNTLLSQYNKLNVTLIESSNSTATSLQPPQCSSGLISADGFGNSFDIPAQPQGASDLIKNGVQNPPTGSMVSMTQTTVNLPVYATNGVSMTGLKITPVQQANAPGQSGVTAANPTGTATTGGATGTQSGAAGASPTKSGAAAPNAQAGVLGGAVAAAVLGAGMMIL